MNKQELKITIIDKRKNGVGRPVVLGPFDNHQEYLQQFNVIRKRYASSRISEQTTTQITVEDDPASPTLF